MSHKHPSRLTSLEFQVLNTLRTQSFTTLADLSAALYGEIETVSLLLTKLTEQGLLNAELELTEAGLTALAPYKVRNAVIMAAGFSSRFAPISWEIPKGLLKVRGERLIERQIQQLQAVGIPEIIVVGGYKLEKFLYLEAKYGVKVIANPYYKERNNNSSIFVAQNYLGNSYICSSDNYFTENPFNAYEYDSYYSAVYMHGETEEWCIDFAPDSELITQVTVGGKDAWTMLGHTYWSQNFADTFRQILQRIYTKSTTADKLWEAIYIEHITQLPMRIKRFPAGIIHEFDAISDLAKFDRYFLENLSLHIFDNITQVLQCSKLDITNIEILNDGLTNNSFRFDVKDKSYVYRIPGKNTEQLVNRRNEAQIQQIVSHLGLDSTFIYQDPESGWKISHFINNAQHLDPHNPTELAKAMELLRTLHTANFTSDAHFDFYRTAQDYLMLVATGTPNLVETEYQELNAKFNKLYSLMQQEENRIVLCHNDYFKLNILKDTNDTYYVIDWEYAGLGSYTNDLATFAVCNELSEAQIRQMLDLYLERPATENEIRLLFSNIACAGWCWFMWCLVKSHNSNTDLGNWPAIYFRYAVTYLKRSLALYQN